MNENTLNIFLILLPIVALLYASVGHGGASGYLALMAILGFSPSYMKPTALILNCLVSLISFLQYYRTTPIRWTLFLTLTFASIPLAFLGGMFNINQTLYKVILGILLLIASMRLFFQKDKSDYEIRCFNTLQAIAIGAIIGFLSGLIGIGGGILLSPLLIYLRWASFKEIASISALFIFANSLSGLIGSTFLTTAQLSLPLNATSIIVLILAALGGLVGGYLGASKLNSLLLKRILGLVLIIASLKLILT